MVLVLRFVALVRAAFVVRFAIAWRRSDAARRAARPAIPRTGEAGAPRGVTSAGVLVRRASTTSGARRARPSGLATGFTLVELAIVMLIVGVLALLALPGYRAWIERQERLDLANRLVASLDVARSEAMKHGSRVNLCKSVDGTACRTTGGWEGGWLVFHDDDGDGRRAADETVVRVEHPPARGLTARANRPLADYVSFTALGHARQLDGALQMGTITICRPGERPVAVVLANTGRVRVDEGAGRCP